MYDLNKQSKPSLCSFSSQTLCYYIPQSHSLQSLQAKPHHYNQQSQITQLLQTICRQLFYYSSSMQKASSKQQQLNVQNILLENVKKILMYNLDKYGLIMEQKLLYLVVSFMHSKHNDVTNLRELLNQVHYILTSNLWQNPSQQIPFPLTMILNGQFEELLHYAKQQLSSPEDTTLLSNLIDMIVYKIQEKQCNEIGSHINIPQSHISKIISQVEKSNWLKILLTETKKKNLNVFSLFSTKYELEILLAVLCGNEQLIQQVSKGSWGIYLNLYVNFIETLPQTVPQTSIKTSYENVVKGYLQKYFSSNKPSKKSTQEQQEIFLIKLLNTFSPQNRFSFHEIYQSSFSIFSPVLSNLIGLLLLEFKLVDTYSIVNNRDYHEDILLGLIDNCNKIGWTALVYVIGFVQNSSCLRDYQGKQAMWENLMFQYLPYEIESSSDDQTNSLQNQVKQIQQKLQDLNLIGLSSFTKTYLNTLFQLQLKQSNTKLTETILQVFFLTLQMSDSSNANYCFHQMKTFISQYYRTRRFNYQLINSLENIFERKQSILSQKMEQKIEKLFCLIYKIQRVYEISTVEDQSNENIPKQTVVKQLQEFNKMFFSSKKKKSISLSVELLRLAAYLHSRVENFLNIGVQQIHQMSPEDQTQHNTQSQYELSLVKKFEWNIHNYLSEWKSLSKGQHGQQQLSQQALEELNYFDKYFY